ncbi:hypothetical protein ACET3Z_017261 [Daucus carota]
MQNKPDKFSFSTTTTPFYSLYIPANINGSLIYLEVGSLWILLGCNNIKTPLDFASPTLSVRFWFLKS